MDKFYGSIYNGSEWTVTGMRIRVIFEYGQEKWDRKFNTEVYAKPLATGSFFVNFTTGEKENSTGEQTKQDPQSKAKNPFDIFDRLSRKGKSASKNVRFEGTLDKQFDWYIDTVFGHKN